MIMNNSSDIRFNEYFRFMHFGPTESVAYDLAKSMNIIPSEKGAKDLPVILDAGGAYGRDAVAFATVAEKVIVADSEKRYIELGQKELSNLCKVCPDHAKKIDFLNTDILSDDFPNLFIKASHLKADMIYSYQLLHLYCEDELSKLFLNFSKILTDSGHMLHIFLSDRCPLTKSGKHYYAKHRDFFGNEITYFAHIHKHLSKILNEGGFEIKCTTDYHNRYIPSDVSKVDPNLWNIPRAKIMEIHPNPCTEPPIPIAHIHDCWVLCCKKR
jgi:hypothetical protein